MILVHLQRDQLWDGTFYLAGDRMVPEELAIALGLSAQADPEDVTVAEEPEEDGIPNPVLFLLNSGDHEQIATLPTIGEKSAIKIAQQMPEGGYRSIAHCAEVNAGLTWIDWPQIMAMQVPETL